MDERQSFKLVMAGGQHAVVTLAQGAPITARQYWDYLKESRTKDNIIDIDEGLSVDVRVLIAVEKVKV